ncbi:Hypothetical predicted protein [Mytilus galloprovincialis]|uniref:Copper acquisition factor BIM1-like domain-containing protein n=1 Tax=Mytilus galloprovincialis TaxID=29158 RepID=A0A8B6CQJ1_MYTGA|nr:Hypothetical predicted protein [Mytilus galloprovincialis]
MNFLQFVVVGSLVAACSAHLCLLSPPQRGTMMGINKAGANDCGLTASPCGGRMAGMNPTYFKTGENVTVVIQKNLDHYSKPTPGNFKVNLMMDNASTATATATIMDMGEPSLSIYSTSMMIPQTASKGKYMIQVVYNTMNPDTGVPPQFYQCTDVMLH